jgi:hypothetical protein
VEPFGNVIGVSGRIPRDQERTVERKPSETAHAVALCRAFLAHDERARYLTLPDGKVAEPALLKLRVVYAERDDGQSQ